MFPKSPLEELESVLRELNSTTVGRRAFLASVPLLMAACATAPKHRTREGDNTGQEAALTVAEEKKLTQEVLPKMRQEYPPVQDAELQNYIGSLGNRLVRANGLEGNPYNYSFTAVDVGYVNAFALPAGTVMVTAPLIAMADTEAELMGVIGHEVGHVKSRHTAERMFVAKKEQSSSWKYAAGGGLLGGALGFGIGKLLCPPKDKKCLTKAAAYGAAAGVGGGLLVQKFAFMANSREDEMEADRVGFRTAVASGYSKDHVGAFYTKLLAMERERKAKGGGTFAAFSDAMSTHPPSQERVNQMQAMSSQEPGKQNAIVSTKAFDQARIVARRIQQRHTKG